MADTPVGDVLECTICLDIPASPIHNCVNGHIVCGICRDYIITCGICTGQLAVSALAERVSRQVGWLVSPNYYSKFSINYSSTLNQSVQTTSLDVVVKYLPQTLCNTCTSAIIGKVVWIRFLKIG